MTDTVRCPKTWWKFVGLGTGLLLLIGACLIVSLCGRPAFPSKGIFADVFYLNGDGTFTDIQTGLIWQQKVDSERDAGWRIPTSSELVELYQHIKQAKVKCRNDSLISSKGWRYLVRYLWWMGEDVRVEGCMFFPLVGFDLNSRPDGAWASEWREWKERPNNVVASRPSRYYDPEWVRVYGSNKRANSDDWDEHNFWLYQAREYVDFGTGTTGEYRLFLGGKSRRLDGTKIVETTYYGGPRPRLHCVSVLVRNASIEPGQLTSGDE